MTTDLDVDGPHWPRALAIYREPGFAEAAIRLQDTIGLDITILLIAGHALANGRRLDAAALAKLDAIVEPWRREVVLPLRRIRRRLKAGPAPAPSPATTAFRSEVQRVEIAAERIALALLAAKVAELPHTATPQSPRDAVATVIAHFAGARTSEAAADADLSLLAEAIGRHLG